MSANELSELRSFVYSNEFHKLYSGKYEEDRKAGLLKYQKNRKSRQEREERLQVEVYPYLKAYCKQWLQTGDLVRFEGANGSGIRKVVEITSYGIIGLVVSRFKNGEPVLSGYSSENSFEKLMEVYKADLANEQNDTKCWFNRKSIVEFVKSKQ